MTIGPPSPGAARGRAICSEVGSIEAVHARVGHQVLTTAIQISLTVCAATSIETRGSTPNASSR